jgi:hypothetical protein
MNRTLRQPSEEPILATARFEYIVLNGGRHQLLDTVRLDACATLALQRV